MLKPSPVVLKSGTIIYRVQYRLRPGATPTSDRFETYRQALDFCALIDRVGPFVWFPPSITMTGVSSMSCKSGGMEAFVCSLAGHAENVADCLPGNACFSGGRNGGVKGCFGFAGAQLSDCDPSQGRIVNGGQRIGSCSVVGVFDFVKHLCSGFHGSLLPEELLSGGHGVENVVFVIHADFEECACGCRADDYDVAVEIVDKDGVVQSVVDLLAREAMFPGAVQKPHNGNYSYHSPYCQLLLPMCRGAKCLRGR